MSKKFWKISISVFSQVKLTFDNIHSTNFLASIKTKFGIFKIKSQFYFTSLYTFVPRPWKGRGQHDTLTVGAKGDAYKF